MVPEFQKPRVTEIHVRMDCKGCVQKIKKALKDIHGIYDLYIDLPQQKVTIIGWADPEQIVKAIKKTRKIATICNIEPITESPSQSAETEPEPPEGSAQEAPEEATQPQPQEFPQEQQPIPAENNNTNQHSPSTKDVGEDHVMYHDPPNYGNRFSSGYNYVIGHCYHNSSVFVPEEAPQLPVYVTHSYNTHRPSPYVIEYEYVRRHSHYNSCMEHYNSAEYYQNGNVIGNITSMFSDENPNSCRIV